MSELFSPSSGPGAAQQRTALVGRVKMAKAMEMPESDWARVLSALEADPLFQELLGPATGPAVRYKRFPGTGFAEAFYAPTATFHEAALADIAEQRRRLLEIAQQMGRETFERLIVYREGPAGEETARAEPLLAAVAGHLDKFHPSTLQGPEPVQLLGQIAATGTGSYGVTFYFPHLVRGLFDIDRARLREWQGGRGLGKEAASRLRRIVGLMDLANMKQGALWRVLERLLVLNRDYFDSKDSARMAPVSLRKLADQLDFAPSTVSRVVSGKSLMLPWGTEVPISDLMPGQRRVVLSILTKVLPDMSRATDLAVARRLKEAHGVSVSRRTVTACRHIIESLTLGEKAA